MPAQHTATATLSSENSAAALQLYSIFQNTHATTPNCDLMTTAAYLHTWPEGPMAAGAWVLDGHQTADQPGVLAMSPAGQC